MNTDILCVSGGSGFIGRHFLRSLGGRCVASVRYLSRDADTPAGFGARIQVIGGDMRDEIALQRWVAPDSIVVNLAFDRTASSAENIAAAASLARVCNRAHVRRLVHLSTAAVVGQNNDEWIDELSICRPSTAYEKTKMQIERVLADSMPDVELVIVRPTAVFGAGGKNLVKLARETATQSSVLRYMRACFHGRRAMNLVSVQNVAAALCHLALERNANHRDVFIVTDDEITANNYHDVEHVLQSAFGRREYFLPILTLPTYVQNTVVKASGKSPINRRRRYRCDKLLHTGFAKPCDFGQALAEYASYLARQWYSQGRIAG